MKTTSTFLNKYRTIKDSDELKKAVYQINSLAYAPKALRFEQVLDYSLENVSDFKMEDYLPSSMENFLRAFGISEKCYEDKDELDSLLERISNPTSYPVYNPELIETVCVGFDELLNDEEDSQILQLNITTVMGIPIIELNLLWVKHDTWPGILKPYLLIFESLLRQYIKTFERGLIPSCSLEVLCIAERILQYLFSGDIRKLGISKVLSETGLLDWISSNSFPKLSPKYFLINYNQLPTINFKEWPTAQGLPLLNCFSTFTDIDNCRKLCFDLETSLMTYDKKMGQQFFNFILNLSISFYVKQLTTVNETGLVQRLKEEKTNIFTDTELLAFLSDKKLIKNCGSTNPDQWIKDLVEFFFNNEIVGKKSSSSEIQFCLGLINIFWPEFSRKMNWTTKIMEEKGGEALLKLEPRALWLPFVTEKTVEIQKVMNICYTFQGNFCL
jgi:hypothetical protein